MLEDVVVADTYRARFRGLNLPGVTAILLHTSSVHTFTMRQPIRVTLIGDGGRVGESMVLEPRRIASIRGRMWVLETSIHMAAPCAGIVVHALPSGIDVRDTHTLRNPDRKPI